jgi:hypothetical protein
MDTASGPRARCALPLALLLVGGAEAQERRRLHVPTVELGPVTDGDLSDPVWTQAVVLSDLTQVQPIEGIPAEPPTRILLLRTHEALHVAFECFEPVPEGMVIQDQRRDGSMAEDESVKVVLDTFGTGESAVWFVVSAAGGRLDGLITENGGRINSSWDGYWKGETRILADRWIAELELPFRGLTFPAAIDVWRANFERYHGRRRAYYRWQGARRQYQVSTVSECGELTGFASVPPTAGVEVIPFMTGRHREDDGGDESLSDLDFGGEVEWRVTPQLTASFSANTDFAETEVDARVVNLSRFGVTFPEKRDFFLRDSQLFEFGWESGFSGGANAVPFRSRRIGLAADGSEVPIDAALRLAGRVGRFGLGLLGVRTDDTPEQAGDTFLVARPTWRVDEAWSTGLMLTSGDPLTEQHSTTYGIDGSYSGSEGWPGLVRWDGWFMGSRDDDVGGSGEEGGTGFGSRATLNTSDWDLSMTGFETEETLRPALGYVLRPGERFLSCGASWRPRPSDEQSPLRNYSFGLSPFQWSKDGETTTAGVSTTLLGLSWHDGSSGGLSYSLTRDRLEEGFSPVPGVEVPAGTYGNQSLSLGYSTPRTRSLSGSVSLSGGHWYDGDLQALSTSLRWNPGPSLDLSASWSGNHAQLPGGSFSTSLESLSVGWSASPRLRLESIAQYDNVSENLGFQGRLRFTQEDGRELYLVTNFSWQQLPSGRFVDDVTDVILKVQYTWRF